MEPRRTDNKPITLGQKFALENHLGGYHRCFLGAPIHLEFMSENLCKMLGYTKRELTALIGHAYTGVFHPDDSRIFDKFCYDLAQKEESLSVTYRMIKKDGTVIRVADTMTSIMGDDGEMRGYSVVCQIPDDPNSPTTQEKIAVLRVKGGKTPQIEQFFGMSQEILGSIDAKRPYSLMSFVSLADQDKIHAAFERAYKDEYSGKETCVFVAAEGRGLQCNLWVELNDPGTSFDDCAFCVKVELEKNYEREENVASFSKHLLSNFAEDIFEVDRLDNSIKYVCQGHSNLLKPLVGVRMNADDFLGWLLDLVSEADRKAVAAFYQKEKARPAKTAQTSLAPNKLNFEMYDNDRSMRIVTMIVVPISSNKYFLCLNTDFRAMGTGFCSAGVAERKDISIRLFGSFSLSVNGEAVHIRCEKGRELLALLAEKRGAFLSTREAISALWECEPDETSRARYRKIASRLMTELKKFGIDYIVETDRGARRIIPEFISCDYYDYRDGLTEPAGPFLPEYSWSEFVLID